MCWTVWALWSVAMCILPSLKSECASRSWPPRQLEAVLLDWTVTPSANKPVKDQWGGGGPGSWPVLSSNENNEDPAPQPADRSGTVAQKVMRSVLTTTGDSQARGRGRQLWGNVLTQTIGLWIWKGLWKNSTNRFHFFFFFFFACTKTCVIEAYTQMSLKGLLPQLK